MTYLKIDRQQKNSMREHLEKMVEKYKEINLQIEIYRQEVEAAEYRQFFDHIKARNTESIQIISKYMVGKCNR